MKWIDAIFGIIAKFSHSGETPVLSSADDMQSETLTIVSAADDPMSEKLARESTIYPLDSASNVPEVDDNYRSPMDAHASLYASVSQLLGPEGRREVQHEGIQPSTTLRSSGPIVAQQQSVLPRYHLSDDPPPPPPEKPVSPLLPPKRGAWSDAARQSIHSEAILDTQLPSKAIARDLQRILTMLTRNGSVRMSQSHDFPRQVSTMHDQLENVSKQLRRGGSAASRKQIEAEDLVGKVDGLLE